MASVLVLSTRPSKKGRTIEPFSNLSVVPSVISGVVQFMVAIIRKGNPRGMLMNHTHADFN